MEEIIEKEEAEDLLADPSKSVVIFSRYNLIALWRGRFIARAQTPCNLSRYYHDNHDNDDDDNDNDDDDDDENETSKTKNRRYRFNLLTRDDELTRHEGDYYYMFSSVMSLNRNQTGQSLGKHCKRTVMKKIVKVSSWRYYRRLSTHTSNRHNIQLAIYVTVEFVTSDVSYVTLACRVIPDDFRNSRLGPESEGWQQSKEAFALLSLNKTPLFSRRYEEEKEKFALISRKTKRNSRMMWVMISRELSLGNGLGVMARAELRSLHLISSLPAAGS
ncbi:hypothetical protein V1477_018702, partial [Vespula maculifrons]